MDWKSVAIEKLKNHHARKQALVSIPLEIAEVESALCSIRSASIDRLPTRGGGSGYEEKLLNQIVRKEELQRLLDRAQMAVNEVTGALQLLDQEEQLVLARFYINPVKGNVERLCAELFCDQSTVYRRKDAALRKFTIALYGCVES